MLSNKARYALHAMLYLAEKGGQATVAEISESKAIPRKFLEQILGALRLKGLVIGRRGPYGGYSLAREAGEISYADILRSIDGPLALAPCATSKSPRKCEDCQSMKTCRIRPALVSAREETARILESTTLRAALEGAPGL